MMSKFEKNCFICFRDGSMTVKMYHGSDRSENTIKSLLGVDVVVTSYKILEIEYRKATAGCKV